MDAMTILIAAMLTQGIPGTASAEAVAAAAAAAASEANAATHNYGISVDENNRLVVVPPEEAVEEG